MTTKVTFFIGLNDKDSKIQEVNTLEATKIIERVFVDHKAEGATFTGGRGIYRHESGEIVVEETVIVQIFEFGEPVDVRGICEDLKKILNQESIAVERQETNSALY